MFVAAKDLYMAGYDVHMYDEDVVDPADGSGAAFDEIANAVKKRGVTEVAIYGFSHGGGATYLLAQRMDTDPVLKTTLAFTAYVDAIEKSQLDDITPETDLPPNTQYHLNQYETNDPAVHGEATIGQCENIDRSDEVQKHIDLDNNSAVVSKLEVELRWRVAR
jgi:hypothetical protein